MKLICIGVKTVFTKLKKRAECCGIEDQSKQLSSRDNETARAHNSAINKDEPIRDQRRWCPTTGSTRSSSSSFVLFTNTSNIFCLTQYLTLDHDMTLCKSIILIFKYWVKYLFLYVNTDICNHVTHEQSPVKLFWSTIIIMIIYLYHINILCPQGSPLCSSLCGWWRGFIWRTPGERQLIISVKIWFRFIDTCAHMRHILRVAFTGITGFCTLRPF